ncbi:MAG TPA: hypothetical protein PK299_14275 [Anaerolineales bacterium]|nr:hypothetical protein [Anaerolineales bacterium]
MNPPCIHHPEISGIEKCEVCGNWLCADCLWYAESGERLCPAHADEWKQAGKPVLAPTQFESALVYSQVESQHASDSTAKATLHGNQSDIAALLALVVGIVTLSQCVGGMYCLPFIALGLGIYALTESRKAVDEKRSRTFAWVGIGTSALIFLGIFMFIFLYIFIIVVSILNS